MKNKLTKAQKKRVWIDQDGNEIRFAKMSELYKRDKKEKPVNITVGRNVIRKLYKELVK